jgi:hypothetical protein
MFVKTLTFFALLLAASASGEALAADACQVSVADIDKAGSYGAAVSAIIRDAPDCHKAASLLQACQLGSSGDNALADIVQAKCEPLFLSKAAAATKKTYKATLARCDKIAETHSGSMYQSQAAICRAEASANFARKYSGTK